MTVRLRALERDDLALVHRLTNDSKIMSYWFSEPFEALVELRDIYDRHVHDLTERRFVITDDVETVGIVELIGIDAVHRTTEFQIIVAPEHQGHGHASTATALALDYAFAVLNLHKVFLVVDVENVGAIRVYRRAGFVEEGTLREEFFANGRYHDALRMGILQREYLGQASTG